jgi:hypothetical protein
MYGLIQQYNTRQSSLSITKDHRGTPKRKSEWAQNPGPEIPSKMAPHSQGHHLILSKEGLSRKFPDSPHVYKMIKSIFGEGWNLCFNITYRHYFDWLYSLYSEKTTHGNRRGEKVGMGLLP